MEAWPVGRCELRDHGGAPVFFVQRTTGWSAIVCNEYTVNFGTRADWGSFGTRAIWGRSRFDKLEPLEVRHITVIAADPMSAKDDRLWTVRAQVSSSYASTRLMSTLTRHEAQAIALALGEFYTLPTTGTDLPIVGIVAPLSTAPDTEPDASSLEAWRNQPPII